MDIGVISVRYARALLKASVELSVEEQVYSEMQTLAQSYIDVPELRHTLDNPMLLREKKAELILAACGGTNVSNITQNFVQLILNEGREGVAQFIANSYITLYRKQKNIISGTLTTAVPVSEDTEVKMKALVTSRTNGTVQFNTKVDPEILGGFILEYDTYRLDTSVKAQLKNIMKKLA